MQAPNAEAVTKLEQVALELFAGDGYTGRPWQMHLSERTAFVQLLRHRRPPVAIEIGVQHGGSLGVVSHHAEKVYGLDLQCPQREAFESEWPNVELRLGDSRETLPALLSELQAANAELGFVLVDGDHSAEGVRADLDTLLGWRPPVPLWIVMHDSFNPACRAGMRGADWERNPYVQYVNLDFVPGALLGEEDRRDTMWGGLGVALLEPIRREGPLEIIARFEYHFQAVKGISRHP